MVEPKILDLFCCQGGAGMGYHRAGFRVYGIDKDPQPRYPWPHRFRQRDALDFLRIHGKRFDAVHASPPCQLYTKAWKLQGNAHPDLIGPTREILDDLGKPYVIENVPGSPLRNDLELCGASFDLGTYRHRIFESNVPLAAPEHRPHTRRTTKMGRAPKDGEMMHVVGNFSGVARAREAMGIDWMTRDGLREAIPPAYTEFIGKQLLAALDG